MAKTRRRARFAQKTKPSRFVTEIFFVDDFQCHRASQIDVERFVSDPMHRDPARPVSPLRPTSVHNARIGAVRARVLSQRCLVPK